jgi:hypothetical protein
MYVFDDAYTTHNLDNPGTPTVYKKALGVWVYELVGGQMEAADPANLNLGATGGENHNLMQQDPDDPDFAEVVMKDLTVMPNGDVFCLWSENIGTPGIGGDWFFYLAHYDASADTWSIVDDDFWGHGVPSAGDFHPVDVSIDNDGEDVYFAWGENRDAGSADAFWWRCMKYDTSADTFTELGSGQTAWPSATNGTREGDWDYPVRLKVSPAGVPWVVGITFDPDAPTFPVNYYEEYCFAWFWDGDEWIDSEIPHPSLVPFDIPDGSTYDAGSLPMSVDPQPGNYIAFAVYNLYYTDLTFCHHDGPRETPAVMHQFVYQTQGAGSGDTSGFAYFECHGVGDWDNELFIIEAQSETGAGPTGVLGFGRDYPNNFVSAQSDYDGNLYIPFFGGWTQGWKLENDGSRPVWLSQKGYFGSGVDHVYSAAIEPDGESIIMRGNGFPTELWSMWWKGYQWIDPTSDGGCVIGTTPVAIWRDVNASRAGYLLAALQLGGAIDLTRIKFRGFALGDL